MSSRFPGVIQSRFGRFDPATSCPKGCQAEAALLIDLAQLLFQFSDQGPNALLGEFVRDGQIGHLAILQNLHFKLNTLVFVGQWRPLFKERRRMATQKVSDFLWW